MREIEFRLQPGGSPGAAAQLRASAGPLPITIEAASLEELQHEAREALIEHFGPAHCAYRVRVRRCPGVAVISIRPLVRSAAFCH